MVDSIVFWGRAQLSWTPTGYRLNLEIALDERASVLFEARVRDVLEDFDALTDPDLVVEFSLGSVTRHEQGGFTSEPAELTLIAGRTLFAVPPVRFRVALHELAAQCRADADAQRAADEQVAREWLAQLRAA